VIEKICEKKNNLQIYLIPAKKDNHPNRTAIELLYIHKNKYNITLNNERGGRAWKGNLCFLLV